MAYPLIDIRNSIPKHPTRVWKKRSNIDTLVLHTSASNNQDPNKTALYHITPSPDNHLSKAGAPGIAYHDFITREGSVYHCTDYEFATWHCGIWNSRSVGVVMAYTGQTGEAPQWTQLNAAIEHMVILCLYLKVLPERCIGHREVPGIVQILGNGAKHYKKTCPGFGVNLDEMRSNIIRKLQVRLSSEGLYRGKVDGIFGPKSTQALFTFEPRKSLNAVL